MVATVNSKEEADRIYNEAIARAGKLREEEATATQTACRDCEEALKAAKKNHHTKDQIKQLEQALETAKNM